MIKLDYLIYLRPFYMLYSSDCLYEILLFLSKNDLKNFSKILLQNKEYRIIIQEILKIVRYDRLEVCNWTYSQQMSNIKEIANIKDLMYVSDYCQDLIVMNSTLRRNYYPIKISNKNLKKLHIDFYNLDSYLEIDCPNLEFLNIINFKNLNEEMIYNIMKNSPKLQKIFMLYSGRINEKYINNMKLKYPDIKIIYK